MITFDFPRRISMAHRLLSDASPKCQTPHGHNEIIRITVGADPEWEVTENTRALDGRDNMLAEFGVVKSFFADFCEESLDHAFQMSSEDPLLPIFMQYGFKLVITPGDPTTEMLAALILRKMDSCFIFSDTIDRFRCLAVRVEETPSNIVTVTRHHVALLDEYDVKDSPWWTRPDYDATYFPRKGS